MSTHQLQPLRPYQSRAVENVNSSWAAGKLAPLLVLPTGAGKTRLGEEIIHRAGGRVLWIAHRRELIKQAAERLRGSLGRLAVGMIAPGADYEPGAMVQVATVQTLLARDRRPEASLAVWDEAHHYVADDWTRLTRCYSGIHNLGLTATPVRQDGRGLGEMFDDLIVGATYSELIRDGYLVSCRAYQPPREMGSSIALDPLEAYQRHAENSQAFLFGASVEHASEQVERFNEAGIPAGMIHGKLKGRDRDSIIERFRTGELRVLANYNVLTEGVDIPAARTVILCREFGNLGAYKQAGGRVLRPHGNKPYAIVIDLCGATFKHGLPTDDCEYSLDGDGIRRSDVKPLRQCLKCGAVLPAALMKCTECDYIFPKRDPRIPKLYSLELKEVFSGEQTPEDAKRREYTRLRRLARDRGFSLYFVQKSYKELFGELPVITDSTQSEEQAEYARLVAFAAKRGFKSGYAFVRFREMFGKPPSRGVM